MIQELEKGKKYKIIVDYGFCGSKRLRHCETFNGGKKEAKIRETQIKQQVKNGSYIKKTDITIQELSAEYLKIKKNLIASTTYTKYEYNIKIINSKIGYVKVQKLNSKILDEFYNYLYNEYISPRTGEHINSTSVQHYYMIINNMLEQAIKWDYIKNNPNIKCEKPKRNRNKVVAYSPEEVKKLVKVLEKEPLKARAVIYLAIDTGARRGEIVALEWDDINLATGAVTINKSTAYVRGVGMIVKETKTENSDRIIYISEATISILRKYRVEQSKNRLLAGSKWIATNNVFTKDLGGKMHLDTPAQIFKRVQDKYGLRHLKFHGLRHTSISLLIQQGVQDQIISRKAGHSSVEVTHSVYSTFYDDEFKAIANAMDAILEN